MYSFPTRMGLPWIQPVAAFAPLASRWLRPDRVGAIWAGHSLRRDRVGSMERRIAELSSKGGQANHSPASKVG